jgi:glutathione S-transferase
MQLYYTPRSHFSRKVRILAAALGLDLELVDAGNVADADPAAFGPNPLMRVPTLLDGDTVVFESDHIAAHLVRRHDPADRFAVLSTDPQVLNARAVLNGLMATEVELLLAARTGVDTRTLPRFDKMRASIAAALDWLEASAGLFAGRPTYLGFHLVCAWDHLAFYGGIPLDQPGLGAAAARISCDRSVSASRPA